MQYVCVGTGDANIIAALTALAAYFDVPTDDTGLCAGAGYFCVGLGSGGQTGPVATSVQALANSLSLSTQFCG